MLPYLSFPVYSIFFFNFIEGGVGNLPFKKKKTENLKPQEMGEKNQCTRIGLKPRTTLKWAQWFLEWRSLTPRTFPYAPIRVQPWRCSGSSDVSKRTQESTKESCLALWGMALSVCPEWSLVRKWSGNKRSWLPYEDVWQVALRKNTKSGSSIWQLCVGKWQLRTGTDLPSMLLDQSSDEGGQCTWCEW